MKRHVPWLIGLALLLSLPGSGRSQGKDAAELLPAQTLVCVELRQPERLGRELSALTRGSLLDDLPAVLARARARVANDNFFWGFEIIGMFGLMLSPEMISEGSRFQGAVFAITGISKDQEPEMLGILQAGDSNFLPLYMRAWLTVSPFGIVIVGEAEGVPLYRQRELVFQAVAPGGNPVPQGRRETGPVMAMLPGNVLIMGSSVDGVKDAIKRSKGRVAAPNLGNVRAYKDAALRDRPGLFAYVDVEALTNQIEESLKEPRPTLLAAQWAQARAVLNPAALRNLTAALTLSNGSLELQAQLQIDPRQKSPLLGLLSDKSSGLELLHFSPRGSQAAVQLSITEGDKRWASLVDMMDALAKAGGQSDLHLPSKSIREMEEQVGLKLGQDVLGRIRGVAAALGPTGSPTLAVSATDADGARFLEEKAIPRLSSLFRGSDPAKPPQQEIVQGVTIHTLAPAGLLTMPVCYGRSGSTLVFGMVKEEVAAVLVAGGKKEGLAGDARVAAVLKELDNPILAGVGLLGQVLEAGLHQLGKKPFGPQVIRPNAIPAPPPPRPGTDLEKPVRELTRVVEALPPAVASLGRKGDTLTLGIRQSGLRAVAPKVISIYIETAVEEIIHSRGGN
jgi:hypothetical protein